MGYSKSFGHLLKFHLIALTFQTIYAVNSSFAQNSCELIETGYGANGKDPVDLETVVTGLEVPWAIAFLPNNDWLVTERNGRIRRVSNGTLDPQPVLELQVTQSSEGGLLGIALDPRFTQNHFFYVYYTLEKQGELVSRIERYRLSENNTSAEFDKIILDDIPASRTHNGGRLHFGPDGLLYASTGDARNPDSSQDTSSLSGKILRMTPEGQVPNDNPWPHSYAYIIGIRNSQGFDWLDHETLVITDHGPSGDLGRSGHDELNIAKKGANLGWPDTWSCDSAPGITQPTLVWAQALPPGGVSVFRGNTIPGWTGNLVIGSLGSEHLQRVIINSTSPFDVRSNEVYFDPTSPESFGRLREVIQSPQGDLLITTSNCDGRGSCPPEGDKILKLIPKESS